MYKYIPLTAVIIWMLLIFNLSNQPATVSNAMSKGITKTIVEQVEMVAPHSEFSITSFNHIIRKNAHFIVYLSLAMLVIFALRRFNVRGFRSIFLTFLICVLYAISDEFHQLFVPGRGAQVKDVFIDSAGACVGIGIYFLIGRKRKVDR